MDVCGSVRRAQAVAEAVAEKGMIVRVEAADGKVHLVPDWRPIGQSTRSRRTDTPSRTRLTCKTALTDQ